MLFTERLENIKRLVSDIPLKGKKVLDIGCGGGMVSAYFCEQESSVFGIDISENMIRQADTYVRSLSLSAKFSVGDASALEFPDSYFDVITCISVIEWLDKDTETIQEIRRVLKPNGIAIVSVPNQTSWIRKTEKGLYTLQKMVPDFFGLKKSYLGFQKHQYRPKKFDELCKANNLHKIDSLFYVVPLSRFSILKKLSKFRVFGMMYFIKLQKSGD